VVGLDYYHHTEVELYTSPEGYYRQWPARKPSGLYLAAQAYWHRYRLPFMVSETSATGADSAKLAWLQKCVNDVRRLRAHGFPCIGFTWWPLIDHLDWDGAMLHQTGHIHSSCRNLLATPQRTWRAREKPTVLADRYRALIEQGDGAVGPIASGRARTSNIKKGVLNTPLKCRPTQPPLVVHSSLPWDSFRSRPHHLAEQLATDRRVFFVEPPSQAFASRAEDRRTFALDKCPLLNVFRGAAARTASPLKLLDSFFEQLTSECSRTGFPLQEAIHWAQHASLGLRARERFDAAPFVFDVLEDRGFELGGEARQLCKLADALVFRSRSQEERLAGYGRGLNYFIADGVESRHFLKATRLRTPVPHDSRFIQRPLLAYAGGIDERLDLKLLERLAVETSDWSVMLVGPVSGISPESLPRLGNIYWLGPRPTNICQITCAESTPAFSRSGAPPN
jgi:hypothetical protein